VTIPDFSSFILFTCGLNSGSGRACVFSQENFSIAAVAEKIFFPETIRAFVAAISILLGDILYFLNLYSGDFQRPLQPLLPVWDGIRWVGTSSRLISLL
jgi:hypothetical protein